MIAVVDGSGLLGKPLVEDLVAAGERVRVVVRDTARARAMFDDAVEVAHGDVRERDSLPAAIAGADVVVSAVHGFLGGRGAGPSEVDEHGNANLVDAVAAASARVVLMSASGASPDHPVDLFRAKYAAEQYLRASGVPWTIVRAPAYRELWFRILSETAGNSGRPRIFGKGEEPIPFVSVVEVAAVVSRAARDEGLRGQLLEVAGEPMTMEELARELQAARGWTGSPRHVPRTALRVLSALARPLNPALSRQSRSALVMDAPRG